MSICEPKRLEEKSTPKLEDNTEFGTPEALQRIDVEREELSGCSVRLSSFGRLLQGLLVQPRASCQAEQLTWQLLALLLGARTLLGASGRTPSSILTTNKKIQEATSNKKLSSMFWTEFCLAHPPGPTGRPQLMRPTALHRQRRHRRADGGPTETIAVSVRGEQRPGERARRRTAGALVNCLRMFLVAIELAGW